MDYKIPDTYEEGIKRKKELLDNINKYNEALFNGQDLPFTEEEIDSFQEEYELLDDSLALSKEEKLAQLDDDEKVVLEDGTVTVKKTWLDQIHWSMYIYITVSLVLAIVGYFMQKALSSEVINKSLFSYFEKVFDKSNDQFELMNKASEYYMGPGRFWFIVIGSHFIIPSIIAILSVVVYFLYRKMHNINTKIALIMMIVNISLIVIYTAFILGLDHIKGYIAVYDNLGAVYYQYIMSQYGGGM